MKKSIVICITLVLLFVFPKLAMSNVTEAMAIKIILGEARDKRNRDYSVWIGIAEVIRKRNTVSHKIFCALKDKDLDSKLKYDRQFLLKLKKVDIFEEARRAWKESKHTNITKGATHFENIRAFGKPSWHSSMKKTITIKDITFYKKKE